MYLHAPAVYASLWVSCVRHVPVVSFSQLAGVCCKRLYDCCYRHQRMFRQKSYQQHQEQTRIIPAMIVRSSQIRQQPLLVHVSTMCNNTDWMPRSACKKRIKKSLSSHVVTLTVACSLQHMSLSKNKPNLHVRCLVSTSTQFWEQLQRLRLVLHFDKLCDKVLHKFSLIWGLRRSSPSIIPCVKRQLYSVSCLICSQVVAAGKEAGGNSPSPATPTPAVHVHHLPICDEPLQLFH